MRFLLLGVASFSFLSIPSNKNRCTIFLKRFNGNMIVYFQDKGFRSMYTEFRYLLFLSSPKMVQHYILCNIVLVQLMPGMFGYYRLGNSQQWIKLYNWRNENQSICGMSDLQFHIGHINLSKYVVTYGFKLATQVTHREAMLLTNVISLNPSCLLDGAKWVTTLAMAARCKAGWVTFCMSKYNYCYLV